MKSVFVTITAVVWICFAPSVHADSAKKIRVIATTDGEIDDRCSMIRFLMYSNEWDIRGIIHSSSKYHWKGDAAHKRHNWEDESWLDRQLDAYAKVYPKLKANDPGYPTPDYLRRQVFEGNVAFEGAMELETPGSNHIVEALLDPDPSPLWLQAWGGANTIARALKTIEEKHPDQVEEVSRKARLFLITRQDETMDTYILKRWPKIQLILCNSFGAIAYNWQKIMTPEEQKFFDGRWMKNHILENHGSLAALYEARPDGAFRSEGDSPSFMHCIDVGLGSHVNPAWGGWGGRFLRKDNMWLSALDDRDRYRSILRWAPAFQNDWAARAEWCVKPPEQCNHPPVVVCNGDRTKNVLRLSVDPDSKVELNAAGTSDPDGNALSYRWRVYQDAGSYWDSPEIIGKNRQVASLSLPSSASGRTIHVILEVSDNGTPTLTRYRRVILQVSGKPQLTPKDQYLSTPLTRLGGPPAKSGKWTFYRGINVNGPPVKIDGQPWEGDNAKGFTTRDRRIDASQVTLRPPTDDTRAKMIHSFRWDSRARFALNGIPPGTYAVYLYVWEDNKPEDYSISLNGKVVQYNHHSGQTGEWHRLGPWTVDATGGNLELTSQGGAANVSGIEIWKKAR